jgi:hypothetical protein
LTNSLDVGTNLTGTITNLAVGATFYFVATATGTNQLMSDFSNEVEFQVPAPPESPSNLRIDEALLIRVNIQGTIDLTNYTKVFEFVIDSQQPIGLFRAELEQTTKPSVTW